MAVPSWAQTYLDMINGNGTNQFFWHNWNTSTNENPYDCTFNGTIASDYSWRNYHNITDVTVTNAIIYQTNYTQIIQVVERATININGSGDSFSLSQSLVAQNILQSYRFSKTTYQTNFIKAVNSKFEGYVSSSASTAVSALSYTGTLENCLKYLTNNIKNCNIYVNGEYWSGPDEPPAPVYNWQSVPSVSGKNGILLLSHVRDDSILTGQDIINLTPAQVKLEGTTQISSLIANVPIGKAVKAIYAGKVDFLGIMKDNSASSTVRISVAGNNVYLASFISQKNYIGFIIDDENEVAKLSYIMPIYDPITEILDHYEMHVSSDDATEMHNIWLFIHSHIDNEDDNPENNEADEGTPDNFQPDIAITGITKPAYGAIDTGFTTMYRMSKGELQRLSNFLWTDSFVSNVKKFFNDPREIIVGLSIMPVLPDTEETPGSEVKAGGISTGVYGLKLTDQYKLETYGVIEVKAEKGNFLDYAPYTQVTAHLPFVGAHSLDVNDVMGKQLVLKYIFDFLTGSCVAEIDVYDDEEKQFKPRYFFGGSCGIQVPSSSEDFSRMYSSILSAGATLGSALSTIATGGLTAPLLLGTASNMLANGMNGSPSVEFSSGSGSVNGMIGCKAAYLVISKPKEKVAKDQQKYVGKPSFITRTLSSCTGYTKCLNVHLDNVPCTATERAEIERLLLDGVRIATGSTTPEYTPTADSDHGLIFLKCTSDMDVIGKSWDEEDELTVEGKLLFDQDMLTPKFVLHTNTLAYNYCYIPDFGRFYYVTKQLIKTGSETEIHLQCDVLQSWKTQILSNKAVLERSAKDSNVNAYFSDSMYWTQADKEVKTVPFLDRDGNELVFEIPENNYILTIAGSD